VLAIVAHRIAVVQRLLVFFLAGATAADGHRLICLVV
jgi:hypothetical protein